jgi:GNAT superfamily N-acetyltransferase
MRLVSVKENPLQQQICKEMIADYLMEMEVERGETKSRKALISQAEQYLHGLLIDNSRNLFLFEKGKSIVGFAEVYLEEECFPDEDLPEECVKLVSLYIAPAERRKKLGTSFFKLVREWGRDQQAALIEIEVPVYLIGANQFLAYQGLELVGSSGKSNCYRSFV